MTATLETTIARITVYPDRARVTRTGQIQVEPGQHDLEIPDLPLTLSPESVRASGRGTARARLGGVDLRRVFYTETPTARAAELEHRIQEIEDQEKALTDEKDVLTTSLGFLRSLAEQSESFGRGLAYGKFSVEESVGLLSVLAERTTAAQERLRAIAVEQRELTRQKKKLQQELEQIRSARPRERYAAAVEIDALTPGNLEIELTYVVNNASWTPLYDLRLIEGSEGNEGEKPSVEMTYLAQVTQRSGEDWTSAQLTLSTARPALSATLPELSPWYIKARHPPAPMPAAAPSPQRARRKAAGVEAEEKAKAAFDDLVAMALAEPEPVAMEVVRAAVSQEGAAVTFTVPQPADVPSDGSPHKTTVTTLSLTPELDYLTAPKLVSAAYRRANIINDTEFVLLPGSASIFYGNEFVGTTQLDHIAPNETFKVFLGADERVKVERKLIKREVDKRLLGDRRRLRYAYRIEVKNLCAQSEKIIVQDQLPVSSHEDIKIRPEEILPEPDKQTDLGLLEWQLALEPGQETELVFEFVVEHRRDLTVTGLPEV